MRVLPVLVLAGCGPTLVGWWDLDRWQVERDGESIQRSDAGFAVWSEDTNGSFDLLLRYDYDPAAFDLVPVADAPLYQPSYDLTEFHPPDPIAFSYGDDSTYYALSLDVVSYRTTRMVLQGPSPILDDPATWTWTLLR